MRGDQLSQQWRVVRAIEASPNGLTVAEIAKQEETGIRIIYRDLDALQAAGFPLYTDRVGRSNRWTFIDILNFKISQNFRELILSCESARTIRVFGLFCTFM